MGALPIPKLSVEEYLDLDRAAEIPSEYHDGEMFPIEAVSLRHGKIATQFSRRLADSLDSTSCTLIASAMRVRVSPTKFVIPDMLVYCGTPALTDEHQDTITNPKVIIEVLSPSTRNYDYGDKFALYRRLESFQEYVLVDQDRPRIEIFRKAPDNSWILRTYEGVDTTAPLESLGILLRLNEVYSGTTFD